MARPSSGDEMEQNNGVEIPDLTRADSSASSGSNCSCDSNSETVTLGTEEDCCSAGRRGSEAACCWKSLPVGAEHIVKTLAAEQILHEQLNHFGEIDKVNFASIKALVQQFPAICHRTYEWNWYEGQTRQLTPLAVLCCLQAPLHVIQAVHRRHPAATTTPEPTTTALPLDYACSYEAPVEVVQFLLDKSPRDAVRKARHERLLPLHLACHFSAPPKVVSLLLKAYPEAIENHESEGWYALHAAAAGCAPLSVISQLYQARPESALCQDSGESTPLHIACNNGADWNVIDFLVRSAPEALRVRDMDSLTPLFRVVRNHPHATQVVERLLTEHPQVDTVDALGGTLLHHAAGHNPDPSLIAALCRRFPHMVTARTTDQDQFIPLHIATLFGAPLEIVQALVENGGSETVLLVDSHGQSPRRLCSHDDVYNYLSQCEEDVE